MLFGKVHKILALPFMLIMLCSCGLFTSVERAGPDTDLIRVEDAKEENEPGRAVTIGLSLATTAEERWVNEKAYFEGEARNNGAGVVTMVAGMDENLQRHQIEQLIAQRVDVLVIAAVNARVASSSVDSAKKAGIPVMAYSRMIDNADLDAFIGFDVEGIGEILAKEAVSSVPKGNYMIINGSSLDNNARLEQVGYYNVLKPFIEKGDIRVVYEKWCENWSPDKAFAYTVAGLEENKDNIDAILISNDGMAGGVVRALKERKINKRIFVSGTDGELAALKRISMGTQSVTLLFPQKEFAEEAARAALSLAKGFTLADATGRIDNGYKQVPTIFARAVPINRENIYDTIIKPGIYRFDEIFYDTKSKE